jgi:hypothetical protein
MIYILIAIFWSSSTSMPFTVEFNTKDACIIAGEGYVQMIDFMASQWVSSSNRPGVLPSPAPAHATYICVPKGDVDSK